MNLQNVDYILCLHSTEKHWENMAEVVAPQGKITSIVELEEPIDIGLLKNKSASFSWEFMFTRPLFQTADCVKQHELLKKTAALVDEGKVKTTLTETLYGINAENMRLAHEKVESDKMIGKLVVEGF
ncbi:zinc-binding dehydrogenase [Bacillaceae bacterium Marseille-Q3522]|nr:zinc-binding dehydrogenase [Bacillaceae bacterium Marseille-Q3522]